MIHSTAVTACFCGKTTAAAAAGAVVASEIASASLAARLFTRIITICPAYAVQHYRNQYAVQRLNAQTRKDF